MLGNYRVIKPLGISRVVLSSMELVIFIIIIIIIIITTIIIICRTLAVCKLLNKRIELN
jgi:hypothetical protein